MTLFVHHSVPVSSRCQPPRGRQPLLLVPPQWRRHHERPGPSRHGPLLGIVGRGCLCRGRPAGNAAQIARPAVNCTSLHKAKLLLNYISKKDLIQSPFRWKTDILFKMISFFLFQDKLPPLLYHLQNALCRLVSDTNWSAVLWYNVHPLFCTTV